MWLFEVCSLPSQNIRDAEEIVFVLWRLETATEFGLLFSKLLPEALYASILNSMQRRQRAILSPEAAILITL